MYEAITRAVRGHRFQQNPSRERCSKALREYGPTPERCLEAWESGPEATSRESGPEVIGREGGPEASREGGQEPSRESGSEASSAFRSQQGSGPGERHGAI